MFPLCAATIAGVYREFAPPPDLAAHVACVWTSVVARRRDPPRRLRGHRLARRPAGGRRAGDRAAAVRRAARARGCSACASGSAWRARRSGCPRGEFARRRRCRWTTSGAAASRSAWRSAGRPRCSRRCARGCAARARSAGARRGAGDGAAGRACGLGAGSGRQRAPVAAALRGRRRLRAEDARAGAAVPAVPGAGAGGGELARLAFAAGYADQAHLTRECRRLAGRTPAELVAAGARRRRASASDSFKPRTRSARLPCRRDDDRTGRGSTSGRPRACSSSGGSRCSSRTATRRR